MVHARMSNRFTSVTVILALVAVTVLGLCGMANRSSMIGMRPLFHNVCGAGTHDSAQVAVTSEASLSAATEPSGVPVAAIFLETSREYSSARVAVEAELPPPRDPRFSRTRV